MKAAGVFALTGGAASGKSTVAAMLRKKGVRVLDADALTRTLYEPGSPILGSIEKIFGTTDKSKIREIVFKDVEKRKRLEALLHPVIQSLSQKFFELERQRGYNGPIFYEASLIFEAGRENDFEGILWVTCPESLQLERLMTGRGISEALSRAILASQTYGQDSKIDEARRKKCRWIVDTSTSIEETEKQVDRILAEL